MFIIGFVGKSGSGKTTIAKKLSQKLDCEVINIDEIGHIVTELPIVKDMLIKKFGEVILFPDGTVNRRKLGEIVFGEKEKNALLTEITSTAMEQELQDRISKVKTKYLILDYVLLPFFKIWEQCNLKILVNASQQNRFDRMGMRDNVSIDYLKNRDSFAPDYSTFKFDIQYTNEKFKEIDSFVQKVFEIIKSTTLL